MYRFLTIAACLSFTSLHAQNYNFSAYPLPGLKVECSCDSIYPGCMTVDKPNHCVTTPVDYPDSLITPESILLKANLDSSDSMVLVPVNRHRYQVWLPQEENAVIELGDAGAIFFSRPDRDDPFSINLLFARVGSIRNFTLELMTHDNSMFVEARVKYGEISLIYRTPKKQ